MSPLERDQADFAARLNADPYFGDVGVFLFRPRANLAATTIVGNIEQALNCLLKKDGKGGAAVTVLMPTADAPDGNVAGPELAERIMVRVQELPLANMGASGTRKSAESIAIEVLRLLHLFQAGEQVWSVDQQALTPSMDFAPKITYDVSFRRRLPLSARLKSTMPLIAPDAGATPQEVTIEAAPGATIYYSLDGSLPAPGVEGSVPYAGPVTVSEPCLLRAVAYEAGKAASNVAEAIFS